jgi:hypothetical protein
MIGLKSRCKKPVALEANEAIANVMTALFGQKLKQRTELKRQLKRRERVQVHVEGPVAPKNDSDR